MTMSINRLTTLSFLVLVLAAANGCDSNSSSPVVETNFNEQVRQGATRYLDVYTPMSSSIVGTDTVHRFGVGDGPLCLDGSEYIVSTRDGSSGDLVIFLEGGGGCWSTFCQANETANAGVNKAGILDPALAGNPLASWDVTYLPYCDGSLFIGDIDNDYENDSEIEYQRGLKNLSAGLDIAKRTYPSPSRIVLAGNSGGGYGTIFALTLVRNLYPDTPIDVINDSGVGVAVDGDPTFLNGIIADWNASALFPKSICPGCYADGHLTEFFGWQFEQDNNFRLAMLSSKQDFVIGTVFLQVGGPAFEAALVPQLAKIESLSGGRMASWVTNGTDHTFVQRDVTATGGGVTVLEWVRTFIENDNWTSVSD